MIAHPAAELFPMMDIESLDDLANDIQQHGLAEPIVIFEGQILDGRNRLRACEMTGVEPRFVTVQDIEPMQFVVSRNLHRRHLTIPQRAAIAVDLLPIFTEEARLRKNVNSHKPLPPELAAKRGPAIKHAGDAVSISQATVLRAQQLKKGSPEIFERMRRGQFRSVDGALREAGLLKDYSEARTSWPKTDRWLQVTKPFSRYLKLWAGREYRHLNPREASKRLSQLEMMQEQLAVIAEELKKRAVKARTTI